MWKICMPILKSLAPVVWEENEVTFGRTDATPFCPDAFTKILNSPSLRLGWIKYWGLDGVVISTSEYHLRGPGLNFGHGKKKGPPIAINFTKPTNIFVRIERKRCCAF